ncbi:protein GRAVITROPIC IN THE LIGHT 1-like [Cornus florida]|uniref:protein GRAVITROPIC IN THE LIGHT 1-like n=1 Tax=Cornus florida TaxID=4283 RepID=UPI0028988BF9|nr:protein GRAVITROPIC IN THE LIGHT 1-like [Cornus florida]
MDSIRPTSAPTKNSKLARTFQKVIHLKTATKSLSNNGFCLVTPQDKLIKRDQKHHSRCFNKDEDSDQAKLRNRASTEAFIAKLFASISAAKAAYAALQMAQFPYNGEGIQTADEAVVFELKALSELKHSFLKKQIDSSPPHVTILLAEIQEQQSLMKMYEITMKKMQSEIESKESEISSLQTVFKDTISNNKSMEKKLNSSASFCNSILDNVKPLDSNPKDFIIVLHYAIRSIRSFVKLMIREMEASNWDIDSAASAIEPEVIFPKSNHRGFAFESFVCKEMFDGFNRPCFSHSSPHGDDHHHHHHRRFQFIDRFKKLKSVSAIQILKYNPNSTFGKFTRTKYLQLIHPKMEASLSGDLNQRKAIESGYYPETAFFTAFAEMSRRVWLLHCLAFSFDPEVSIFQVRNRSRFSEVYMESVTEEEEPCTAADDGGDGEVQVAFTVVPGFKIGKTVIQSQVYLSPATS